MRISIGTRRSDPPRRSASAAAAAASVALALALLPSVATAQPAPTPAPTVTEIVVNYTDPYDGTLLMGYAAVPADEEGGGGKGDGGRPVVVILPDWDGVNAYERYRASMFAELGWAAFAADIYGLDNHQPESFDDRREQTGIYRSNVTLANSRIASAIRAASEMEGADPDKGVALVGYCFGGSLALTYVLSGNDDVDAAVAFHGSLNSVVTRNHTEPVAARVLILSGGEDTADSTKSIMDMEDALNGPPGGGDVWEINRYSGVEHSFTKPTSDAYNAYVDGRSWDSCVEWLRELFGEIKHDMAYIPPPDDVTVEAVNYTDEDGASLLGYVSYPPAADGEDPKPAVVIVHDADGITIEEQTRAYMLSSSLGYVGFAADTFGTQDVSNVDFLNRTQRSELINKYRNDVDLYVKRIRAAVAAVKADPHVDPTRIAIIGYCLGGTGVIDYALMGESEAVAVVSFHGGLSTLAPVGGPIYTKMNIQSGGDDDAGSAIEDLEEAMEAGNTTWEYARYKGVVHAFTNWNRPDRYNLRADVRSWESMRTFLEGSFAAVDSDADAGSDPDEGDGAAADPTAVPTAVVGGADAGDEPTASPTAALDGDSVPPPAGSPTSSPEPEPEPEPSGAEGWTATLPQLGGVSTVLASAVAALALLL